MQCLGISDQSNAAACLLTADDRLRALQEERPTRVKNMGGLPRQAIGWLLADAGLNPADIDTVAIAGRLPSPALTRDEKIAAFRLAGGWRGWLAAHLSGHHRWQAITASARRKERIGELVAMGFRRERIVIHDHHDCHAATAYHGWGRYDRPVLVITCDNEGDGLCATVQIGEAGRLRRLTTVDAGQSPGALVSLVTYLTGMVPDEHEYKLMGMAPYAAPEAALRVRDRLLALFVWDGTGQPVWRRRPGLPPLTAAHRVLSRLFFEERFDAVMGGAQLFVEAMLCEMVRRAVAVTGIHDVALAGGLFMNVKANKAIMEMDDVAGLHVFPSCGDETTAIGALYRALTAHRGGDAVPALGSLYLGPDWDEAAIDAVLAPAVAQGMIAVERPGDLKRAVVERLLAGEVVARFAGREEFGARSLGNRAILADPRQPAMIRTINETIKSRDFWMPFASTLIDSAAADYLVNPKALPAPHMILSFDTTEEGRAALPAGIHPYDGSCRPQVLSREDNPDYWDLIDLFRRRTGVGGLVNTSLNLHGLPIAHRPQDALDVLLGSGLSRLAIGPYLVGKPRI